MFTSQSDGNGYKITLSEPGTRTRGRSFHARNYSELVKATEHYYGTQMGAHAGKDKDCPLCRAPEPKD